MENFTGRCYVLGNHINTDHILIAEYMKYNPAIQEEYEKLGSLAMSGLSKEYPPFIGDQGKSLYPIIVAGENFGCGSSREHAVKALEAAGVKIILAKSFARIFYRNCLNTGKILILESQSPISAELGMDHVVSFDFDKNVITSEKTGKKYEFSSLTKEVQAIFQSGGLFNYARKFNRI